MEQDIQIIEQDLIDKVEASRNQSFVTNKWASKFKRNIEKPEKKTSLSERLSKYK